MVPVPDRLGNPESTLLKRRAAKQSGCILSPSESNETCRPSRAGHAILFPRDHAEAMPDFA